MQFTREGASIMSSVQKSLAFLDSPLVAAAVERSTFDVSDLVKCGPGRSLSLFLQIPPGQLEAQRGLTRCLLATLFRVIGSAGDERNAEVLCLLDEFSAVVGRGAVAVEEALVRGRSSGLRLVLVCQSDSQITAAFKDKPTLVYDNCSTQIYLGASSLETAERLSRSLGEWTQVVESAGDSGSRSHQDGPGSGRQVGQSWNSNWQPQGRALMRPEEILTMSKDHFIALIAGMPPIWARRVKYFADPLFAPASVFVRHRSGILRILIAAFVVDIAYLIWVALRR